MHKNNCDGCIWCDYCKANKRCSDYYSEKDISAQNDDYYNQVIKEDVNLYYENLEIDYMI